MRTVQSEILIDATPERVWEVLTDFAAYPEWSSFIATISGSLEVGGKLIVRVQPPGGRGMTFKPTLKHAEPARHLGWLGRVVVPGVFDGAHDFVLPPAGAGNGGPAVGTHVLQRETFTGVLVGLFRRTIDQTSVGFEEFNRALKGRAEQSTAHRRHSQAPRRGDSRTSSARLGKA